MPNVGRGAEIAGNVLGGLLGAAILGGMGYGAYKGGKLIYKGGKKAVKGAVRGVGAVARYGKDAVSRFANFVKAKFRKQPPTPTTRERITGVIDKGVGAIKAHPKIALGVGGGAGLALLGAGAYAYNRNKSHRKR